MIPASAESLSLSCLSDIEALEGFLLEEIESIDLPVTHRFAPGVYMRELLMPKGSLVIGHEHRTEHLNVVLTGRAVANVDGKGSRIIQAGDCFKSEAGTRKAAFVFEDMRFLTIHPTTETDVAKLEGMLVKKSPTWLAYHERQKLE